MKRTFATVIAVFVVTHLSYGQWTGGSYTGGNINVYNTANATSITAGSTGTGKTSVSLSTSADGAGYGVIQSVSVGGSTWGNTVINPVGGNVGIGTTAPNYKLQVGTAGASLNPDFNIVGNTGIAAAQGNKSIYLWNDGTTLKLDAYDYSASALDVQVGGNGGNVLLAPSGENGGNVAIGTRTVPLGYKFAVNGSAIATSMTVKLYANWPDYVFKSNYRLPSLATVKAYIDKNQHLPDMPSEQEVKDNGINLGEIVKVQTKKIEELTLYLIDKDKQLTEQEARIATLEKVLLKLTQTQSK